MVDSPDNRPFELAWNESGAWRKVLFVMGCLYMAGPFYWAIIGIAYLINNEGERFFGEAWFRRTTYFGWVFIASLAFVALIILLVLLVVGFFTASY